MGTRTVGTVNYKIGTIAGKDIIVNMERQEGDTCGIYALHAVLRAYECGKTIQEILEGAMKTKSTIGDFNITLVGETPVAADIPVLVGTLKFNAGVTPPTVSVVTASVADITTSIDAGKILMVPFYVNEEGEAFAPTTADVPKASPMPHWCVVWGYCGNSFLVSHGWDTEPYVFDKDELVASNRSITDLTVEEVEKADEKIKQMLENKPELRETLKPKLATRANMAGQMVVFTPPKPHGA